VLYPSPSRPLINDTGAKNPRCCRVRIPLILGAGLRTAWSGTPKATLGGLALQQLTGISQDNAELSYGLLGLSPVAMEAYALNKAVNVEAAANAWARGTYAGSITHISGVELSKSQSKMLADFKAASYPTVQVKSRTSGSTVGVQFTLPDGTRVRVMQPDGRSPRRASFENANGQPIDPTTGKPPQPPLGLSRSGRKQWVRERTHLIQAQ